MRSWLAVLVLASACAFTPGGPSDEGVPPHSGGGGGGGGSAGPTHQPCELSDPALELCLDFDSAAELGFDSSPGEHDATLSNVVPMTRDGADPAAQFSELSTATIPEDPGIDVTADGLFSIELWAQPTQLPQPQTPPFQVIAHDQYAVTIYRDGTVECAIGDFYADSKSAIATGPWTHVGCTFDGNTVAVYLDGSVAGCYTLAGPWSTPPARLDGIVVGQPQVGGIDNVHVLARTLSADEMCALAGQTHCNTACADGS
ncbi:MAG TPA: LamG domain-containing protein [Kofleriaceae bacterium]|jgi:hypothetical protein